MGEKDPTVVDANQRYAAAAAETVTRIQARDLAVQGFVVLAGVLVSASLTGTGAYQFLAVSIGYAAFAAALLSCHHDIILGLLALFQHRLCNSEELNTNWFSPANFEKVLQGRLLRDVYFAFMVFVGGAIGLAISYPALKVGDERTRILKLVIWILSACSVAGALAYIYQARKIRRRLHTEMHSRAVLSAAQGVVALFSLIVGFMLGQSNSRL
jgi:hypothetical protein